MIYENNQRSIELGTKGYGFDNWVHARLDMAFSFDENYDAKEWDHIMFPCHIISAFIFFVN